MRIGIIGGGVMGLVLAYRFANQGHQVEVFEAAPQVGGLSTWYDFGDFIWDKYYHVILQADDTLLALIDELGLKSKVRWMPTKTGFLWEGQLLSMSNHWEFLTFPALNLWEKLRLAGGILYNQHLTRPHQLDGVTSREWLIKVFGNSVYQTIWEPLLESKFGALKNEVPAVIIWSTLQRYYSTRDKGNGQEKMGHLVGGGLKVLFDALLKKIKDRGGSVSCSAPISGALPNEDQSITLVTTSGKEQFDHVVSTIPRNLLDQPFNDIGEPTYIGVIRLAMVMKEPLSPYYVTNLIDRIFPFTGIIDVTNIAKREEFGGKALVMLPRYDVPQSEWFEKEDQEITDAFLQPLMLIWPEIKNNLIRTFVHREKRVQALWINQKAPPPRPLKAEQGNLWSSNNELIGYSNLNNNAVIGVANKIACEVMAWQ